MVAKEAEDGWAWVENKVCGTLWMPWRCCNSKLDMSRPSSDNYTVTEAKEEEKNTLLVTPKFNLKKSTFPT